MLLWAIVFILNLLLDVVYAKYTLGVQARHATAASIWAAAIVAIGGLSVLAYTHDPYLLIPASIGAYAGTWLTVDYTRFKEKRDAERART